jgi:hypothetical protein
VGGDGNGDGVLLKALGAVVALVTIAGGGLALMFHVRPDLEPCVGGASAEFTGAPVFPRMQFHDHLLHTGRDKGFIEQQPNPLGAEVRYSYRATNLKGGHLPIVWSLVTVNRGEVTSIVRGEDRAIARRVDPDTCTETGGDDLVVLIPEQGKHYRIVLEIYRNDDRTDRLALFETPTFRG